MNQKKKLNIKWCFGGQYSNQNLQTEECALTNIENLPL